jgi:hypothetical protein|nr:MAG TPA: Integrase [Caudoviricetes sp.]
MTPEKAFSAPLTRGQKFLFRELADVYMSCYQGRCPSHAMRLAFFVGELGDKVASEIDGDDVQDALDALIRRGRLRNKGGPSSEHTEVTPLGKPLSPASINRYRAVLQGVLTWAKKRRLMPRDWINPVNETELLPVDNARVRFLSDDEYLHLLKAARASTWKKLHVLIKLAVTTGARKGTLLALRWADVDLQSKQAFAERTKNGEPFIMVLQDDVAAELKAIKGSSRPDELVFCGRNPLKPMNIERPFKTALIDARIEGAVFHTLRHTHASWLARRGVPLLAIADSMNHKSLTMTKRYAHLCVDSRAEMLKRAFSSSQAA